MNIRCNKCGFEGEEDAFKWGHDFFQKRYVKGCPKCDNRQSPGGASGRMFPGQEHPFSFIRDDVPPTADALDKTLHSASEAS